MRAVGIAVGSRPVGTIRKASLDPIRSGLNVPALVWGRTLKVLRAWSDDRCVSESAAVGFFAAFSMAPMLVVVMAVAGFFFGAEAVQGRLFSEIENLLGKDGAVAVQAMVASAWKAGEPGWVGLIALVGVMIGASATFAELTAALGAFVATVLFSIGKHFLALYLAHAGTANAFGAAGSLAVVLMWLFSSAAVFLLGAEVAAHALPRSLDPQIKSSQ